MVFDCAIIGGGFFGLYLARHLATEKNYRVVVFEKEKDVMMRASYNNQARIHNGYHYPRSVLTALRSRASFPRFVEEFEGCVDDSFEQYYAIGALLSKVNAKQFRHFCNSIKAYCTEARGEIKDLFNPKMIDGVFKTKEFAFDAAKLKDLILHDIEKHPNITLLTDNEVLKLTKDNDVFQVTLKSSTKEMTEIECKSIFNCTYSEINSINRLLDLPCIPLKHEITEMCLISPPAELNNLGITVMCGPFFSLMPFPARNLHSLSHVRYTPHFEWHETDKASISKYQILQRYEKKTAFRHMIKDTVRYLPISNHSKHEDSLWEVKTVLPSSEISDSRPILFKANYGLDNYHCIMGGKIDNVFEMIDELEVNFDSFKI